MYLVVVNLANRYQAINFFFFFFNIEGLSLVPYKVTASKHLVALAADHKAEACSEILLQHFHEVVKGTSKNSNRVRPMDSFCTSAKYESMG